MRSRSPSVLVLVRYDLRLVLRVSLLFDAVLHFFCRGAGLLLQKDRSDSDSPNRRGRRRRSCGRTEGEGALALARAKSKRQEIRAGKTKTSSSSPSSSPRPRRPHPPSPLPYLGSSPPLIAHCRVAEQHPIPPRSPPCWATTSASLEHALPQHHQRRRPRRPPSSLRLHPALGQQQLVPSIPPVAANHPPPPLSPRQRSPSLPTSMPSAPQWPSGQSTCPKSSEQA